MQSLYQNDIKFFKFQIFLRKKYHEVKSKLLGIFYITAFLNCTLVAFVCQK